MQMIRQNDVTANKPMVRLTPTLPEDSVDSFICEDRSFCFRTDCDLDDNGAVAGLDSREMGRSFTLITPVTDHTQESYW